MTSDNSWLAMPKDQPKNCYLCGRRILISKESAGFKTMIPLASWHTGCARERKAA